MAICSSASAAIRKRPGFNNRRLKILIRERRRRTPPFPGRKTRNQRTPNPGFGKVKLIPLWNPLRSDLRFKNCRLSRVKRIWKRDVG